MFSVIKLGGGAQEEMFGGALGEGTTGGGGLGRSSTATPNICEGLWIDGEEIRVGWNTITRFYWTALFATYCDMCDVFVVC